MTMADAFLRKSRRFTRNLRGTPLGLLASLVVLTAAAWALTFYQTFSMDMPMGIAVRGGMEGMEGMSGMAMAGIAADGWSLAGVATFLAVWTVMMAAMMLPAAAPMIFMFAAAQARRGQQVAVPTWIFVAGYMLVWAMAGLVVYILVQFGSEFATSLDPPQRSKWAPLALGVTLGVAGLYQFTTLKHICLSHCRSPLASLRSTGGTGGLARSRWGCATGCIASAAAGRCSPCWSRPAS